jgi:hypothetical protein
VAGLRHLRSKWQHDSHGLVDSEEPPTEPPPVAHPGNDSAIDAGTR